MCTRPSWVATRRGLHKPVSSSPPFKTVLATFMAHGLALVVNLHGRAMKRLCSFRRSPRVHSPVFDPLSPTCMGRTHAQLARSPGTWFTDYSVPSFHKLGAFAFSSHPGVYDFPVLRLLRPIRHFLRHWGFVGVSLTSFPLPFASFSRVGTVGPEGMACPPPRTVLAVE